MSLKVKEHFIHLFCICCFVCMMASVHADGILTEKTNLVKLGAPVTLKCTLRKPDKSALQVTWQKKSPKGNYNVASYSPKTGVNVTWAYLKVLNITLLGLNETAITVWKTSAEDEGCYQCIFNFFKTGAIEGESCITVRDDILTEKTNTVKLGAQVTLKCAVRKPNGSALQVTWQKKSPKGNYNVASYSPKTGVNVTWAYLKVLNITLLGLNETAITVWKTSAEDEGCYQCIFNFFKTGAIEGESCITVRDAVSRLQASYIFVISVLFMVVYI
ncbi:uncharacterized protein O3C94_003205 [Discoglossus pictus]